VTAVDVLGVVALLLASLVIPTVYLIGYRLGRLAERDTLTRKAPR
jgi:hypothetical protein